MSASSLMVGPSHMFLGSTSSREEVVNTSCRRMLCAFAAHPSLEVRLSLPTGGSSYPPFSTCQLQATKTHWARGKAVRINAVRLAINGFRSGSRLAVRSASKALQHFYLASARCSTLQKTSNLKHFASAFQNPHPHTRSQAQPLIPTSTTLPLYYRSPNNC